jgi:hypothetical protein
MNITLNEQQMKLVREYMEADAEFRTANAIYNTTDIMSDEFKQAGNRYRQAFVSRDRTANIFAASVAADFGIVSHRGTEITEESIPENPDSYMEDLP